MANRLVMPVVKWDAEKNNLAIAEPNHGWKMVLAPDMKQNEWCENPCTTVMRNEEHHADIVLLHPSVESGAVFRCLLLVAGKHGDIYQAEGYTEYVEDSDCPANYDELTAEEQEASHQFERHWPYAVNIALQARQDDYDEDQGEEAT